MGLETGPKRPLRPCTSRSSYDLADFAVPTGREEEWRFTPLRRLRGLHDGTAEAARQGARRGATPRPRSRVETVGRDDPRLGKAYVPADRVSAQAYASFEQATVVTVPKEAVASAPTVLTVRGEDAAAAAYGHTTVVVEPFAEATVVLDHPGRRPTPTTSSSSSATAPRSRVVSLQDWEDDAVHVSHQHARLGRDARFNRSFVVTLGGDLVRRLPVGRLRRARRRRRAVRPVLRRRAASTWSTACWSTTPCPNCRSHVDYRGALQGEGAHAVWIGDVIIRAEAEGTDTYELNRNLVLTDGTRVDSVPNLEILTGEIAGAGHASASGRLDDEQLFYLQARGIPYDEARRLVVRGFFAQLIEQIEVDEVREGSSRRSRRSWTGGAMSQAARPGRPGARSPGAST